MKYFLLLLVPLQLFSADPIQTINEMICFYEEFQKELMDPSDVYTYYYVEGRIQSYKDCILILRSGENGFTFHRDKYK